MGNMWQVRKNLHVWQPGVREKRGSPCARMVTGMEGSMAKPEHRTGIQIAYRYGKIQIAYRYGKTQIAYRYGKI